MIEPIGDGSRWWLVDGREVDLLGPDHAYPQVVSAACLATRDPQTDEDADIAALCAWIIADHPPWDGGCSTCRTTAACPTQLHVYDVVHQWSWERAWRLARKIRSALDEMEVRRGAA